MQKAIAAVVFVDSFPHGFNLLHPFFPMPLRLQGIVQAALVGHAFHASTMARNSFYQGLWHVRSDIRESCKHLYSKIVPIVLY